MNSFQIKKAEMSDLPVLVSLDRHLNEKELEQKIEQEEIITCIQGNLIIGILRHSKFWDLLPFINWIWVQEEYRGKGIGKSLIKELIKIANKSNAEAILTSTQSDEEAQHFYRKLGFSDVGGFVLKEEPLELIMVKYLKDHF